MVSHPQFGDNDAGADEEETGWKYIHGDVFRFPPQKSLFSACVGTGTQILVMAIAIFMLSLVGVFYPYNRGALLSACVVGLPFPCMGALSELPLFWQQCYPWPSSKIVPYKAHCTCCLILRVNSNRLMHTCACSWNVLVIISTDLSPDVFVRFNMF